MLRCTTPCCGLVLTGLALLVGCPAWADAALSGPPAAYAPAPPTPEAEHLRWMSALAILGYLGAARLVAASRRT